MNNVKVFCLLLVCWLFTGTACTNSVSVDLSDIEGLLRQAPDSALIRLQEIDTLNLFSNRLKAKYSLLLATALDKNYIDTSDTRILQPAIDYYSRNGSNEDKAKTQYYLGRIKFNAEEYGSAAIAYLNALKLSEQTGDSWMKGMSCSGLTWIHFRNHNLEDALKYSAMAYEYFSEYGDSLYIQNALLSYAIALHNNKEFAKADSVFALIPPTSKYYASALVSRGDNCIKKENPDAKAARWFYEEALKNKRAFTEDNYYGYAYSLILTGEEQRGLALFDALDKGAPSATSEWWKYAIARKRGKEAEALKHLEEYLLMQDVYVHTKLSQSVYKAESVQYLIATEKAVSQRESMKLKLILAVTGAILLLLLYIIMNQRQHIKIQKEHEEVLEKFAEAQRMLSLIENSRNEQEASADRLQQLRMSFATMYRQHFSRIGELYNKNFDLIMSIDNGWLEYVDNIRSILKEVADGGEQHAFEERVDKDLDGIMSKIRHEFPSLGESSYRLLSYLIVGFKDRTISIILDENPGTVRSRKSRLRKQILNAQSPNHDLYEAFLK